ncbi:MAG: bifunctional ornithine acetyltransferase/N-acetylglutamate synthase [Methanocellales archaeon]|nr:bifunctional ornithine acetyltransferase/N-acetylglutamate synthase [Methanocellales archaeon]MDD3291001.1 bifunctional ornithine acetyltransferase/N-acetylglutamate synthase [Methanocellales archaeon]MDD5234886.1 bifunctional ornithine acetyltransferase/N-acetylglutamate synthase [Methanocellales archaeon]MDD5484744.1 bifunctional ornithine acetyltransferase/N-acetylglutamate synthase [Methanocellales archaeon]
MKILSGGVCAVPAVKAYGIKESKQGLAVITGKGNTVGVFTLNKIRAAPVVATSRRLPGIMNAVVAYSGSANAFTGKKGIQDAERMALLVASALGIDPESVGVASTGIIGRPINMGWVEDHVESVIERLTSEPSGSEAATRAIMTTDTILKQMAVEIDGVHIGGIAKGSGMIEPDMATMLSFIYTDVEMPPESLHKCLKGSVDKSFNMLVVDGDTSTNDMVLLTATGAKRISEERFQEGLDFVCMQLAKMIARDGEGSTKLIEACIKGARSEDDARKAAKAVVRSPLVKAAVFGEDPNWGRIVAAIGRSGAEVQEGKITLEFSDGAKTVIIVKEGNILDSGKKAKEVLAGNELIIIADLGLGKHEATAWGCDLTYDYVKINSAYMT